MQAVTYTRYGSPTEVLQLQQVDKPSPKDNQVLIKVYASSINAAESLLINGKSFLVRLMAGGLQKPKNPIPGADVAGRVEAVGAKVTRFKVGDAVFGDLSNSGVSAYAEYVCAPESAIVHKPTNITFEQAAAVPLAGVTALQGLRDHAKLQAGQTVLITGASGGVGTFAVQLAKHFGAHVTAMCSASKMAMVRSLGADTVLDYAQTSPIKTGKQYDLIFDIAARYPFGDYRASLAPNGKYLLAGGELSRIFGVMLRGPFASMGRPQKFGNFMANVNPTDLAVMADLLFAGKIKPVIDRCYPLHEIQAAFAHYEAGKASGKIVITIAES